MRCFLLIFIRFDTFWKVLFYLILKNIKSKRHIIIALYFYHCTWWCLIFYHFHLSFVFLRLKPLNVRKRNHAYLFTNWSEFIYLNQISLDSWTGFSFWSYLKVYNKLKIGDYTWEHVLLDGLNIEQWVMYDRRYWSL
jgi:hypothetical protein